MDQIKTEYDRLCKLPSDINEHLPKLKEVAELCETIAEMGVRNVVSTYAFLAAEPKKLFCYDLGKWDRVPKMEEDAKRIGIELVFTTGSVLKAEVPEVDMIFIDTYHTAGQLAEELRLFADKAKKYLAFHDTTTFWENGEQPYENIEPCAVADQRGLKYAIEPFLAANPQWKEIYRAKNNNGLLILQRVK